MKCAIYRSRKKQGAYLYLAQKDDFSLLPDGLIKLFGHPDFSFEFDLTENKVLANADAKEVLQRLRKEGFYLQMPPTHEARDDLV